MPTPKKTHRLTHGQGSFYFRERDQRWVGAVVVGTLPNGKPRRITVTHKREDEAWKKLKDTREQLLRDGPTPDGVKRNQTIKGWAEEWLKLREGKVKFKTEQTDRTNVTKWIIPTIGTARLSTLNASHMERLGDAMLEKGMAFSSTNSAQRTLNNMLTSAVAHGHRVPQSIFAAKKMTLGKTNRAAMTKEQVQATFAAAYATTPDAVKFFIAVLYGARIAEVLALTSDSVVRDPTVANDGIVVGRIDLSKQVQSLPSKPGGGYRIKLGDEAEQISGAWHFTSTKTEASTRVLPLILPVAQAIEAWEKRLPKLENNTHNLLFPRITGKDEYLGLPQRQRAVLAEWRDAQQAAGVWKTPPTGDADGEFFMMHEARHSMISLLMDAGVPKHLIEAVVGQTKLVKNYVHPSLALAGEEINRVLAPLLPPA